jgi:mannose-1-phosphate guanylyltransferase
MNKHHYVAIMAGGIGSRFWPMSRTAHPKQFLDILGTGKTLIQETYDRYSKLVPAENIYIITSKEYVNTVKQQLRLLPEENILAEPSRKNTAPCIAYIAFKLYQKDPEALMIAAPSDNHITDEAAFIQTAKKAFDFVESINALVTIGIKPTFPNTGYGYIQHEGPEVAPGVHEVKTFTEKPNRELAETFVASGDFLWNAGIFTWKVKNVLAAFEKFVPEIYEVFAAEKDKYHTAIGVEPVQQRERYVRRILAERRDARGLGLGDRARLRACGGGAQRIERAQPPLADDALRRLDAGAEHPSRAAGLAEQRAAPSG